MIKLIIEAVIVGLVLLSGSYLLDFRKKKNVFIIGMLIHFIFEITNLNKKYCRYGYACQKLKNN